MSLCCPLQRSKAVCAKDCGLQSAVRRFYAINVNVEEQSVNEELQPSSQSENGCEQVLLSAHSCNTLVRIAAPPFPSAL